MKKLLSLALLFVVLSQVTAQNNLRVDKFEAWKPDFIKKTNGTPSGKSPDQSWQEWCEARIRRGDLGSNTNEVWTVFSDRSNNPTYNDPSFSSPTGRKLSYGERVLVAKVQNGFALVFKDDKSYRITDNIRDKADFLGWVPIDNLLLWVECPKGRGQIYNKALVVWDPDTKAGDSEPQRNPNYILNPNVPSTVSNLTARDLDILFVMKKSVVNQKTYYLLADVSDIKDISTSLKGWLPEAYITEWNQRLTLEPSTQVSVIKEYNDKGLKPVAFMQLKEAEDYFNRGSRETMNSAVYQHNNFTAKVLEPEIMRHPIIKQADNNSHIFQVAVMTGLNGDKNTGEGYIHQKAKNEREIEQLTKKMKNINVIFVIDATHSMIEYYKPIANALKDAMNKPFFKDHDADTKIRVGVVLYRDYLDHSKRGIETKHLTDDLADVSNFLTKVKCNSEDPDDWEAMFDGLETALDCNKMGYSPDQSNFIILIGDAANHLEYKNKNLKGKEEEIGNLMYKNNINFMAYQVRNKGRDEYDYFRTQVMRIQKTLFQQYEQKMHTPMKFVQENSNFRRLVRAENGKNDLLVQIMQKFVNKGEVASAQELTVQVLNLVENFYNKTRDQITFLRNTAEGGYKFSNAADETRLRESFRMAGWDENKINSFIRFQKDGGVAKLKCFAPERFKGAKRNVFSYVLFFSEKELTELLKNLQKVDNSSNSAQAYMQALVNLGMSMIGDFGENDIKKMNVSDMMAKIYGVPISIKTSAGKIENIPYLDDDRLNELIDRFKDKRETLQSIRDNGFDQFNNLRRFEKNGTKYYWIPFETLPGFEAETY